MSTECFDKQSDLWHLRCMTQNEAAFQELLSKFKNSGLAAIAGTTRQYISLWLTVPPKFAPLIAKKTGIPISDILPDPYSKPLTKNPDRWRKKKPGRPRKHHREAAERAAGKR
jgi:hypothetical protein